MNEITITHDELVAAFTEWERLYRENPNNFMSEVHRFTRETPLTYGELCAAYLILRLEAAKALQ